MNQRNIRNFAIISHIDHGKSTLADRMLEITHTVEPRKMRERFLDTLELEQEHGVTIKMQAMRMEYAYEGQQYILNLIDTPGHVDFGYEVSRALAACEGALLLVDATRGIQAQTFSNAHKAQEAGLKLIPVVNKIDLKNADIARTKIQFVEMFGFETEEILCLSGKTGEGVPQLLENIIQHIPAPFGETEKPLRALVFDSVYSSHRGVVVYVRVVEGELKDGEKIELMRGGICGSPIEIGVIHGEFEKALKLSAGEVGYIATGFKDISRCQVGDTVTVAHNPASSPLPGYKKVKPVVFASLFPVDSNDYKEFREALDKLTLNDSSLAYTPVNSPAIGFGFRVGFLGTFHAEIIRERFEREFNLDLIITVPTVEYKMKLGDGEMLSITSPADFPEASSVIKTTEPWVRVSVLSPSEYISPLTQLIQRYRGEVVSVDNLKSQISLVCELPLAEIITNFHDELKSVSSGYASFDYEFIDNKEVDLIKLDILVNYEAVTPFTRLVVREKAESTGRKIVESLREVLPRQQFAVPIQAAIGGKIIARETLPAYRKDVTAKLYGGDRTRKDKLLKKQAKGKKKRAHYGKVNIPKEAFLKVLKS